MARRAPAPTDPLSRPVIGWREWIGIPDLGIEFIKAKVDTGARTSSLHAFNLREIKKDGTPHLRFDIHPEQRSSDPTVRVELPLVAYRKVRDSGGKVELRPVVKTAVRVRGILVPIELTLTRRDSMGFRMLLGRQAIRRRFLVDPGGSYYGGKRPRKAHPIGKAKEL